MGALDGVNLAKRAVQAKEVKAGLISLPHNTVPAKVKASMVVIASDTARRTVTSQVLPTLVMAKAHRAMTAAVAPATTDAAVRAMDRAVAVRVMDRAASRRVAAAVALVTTDVAVLASTRLRVG